MELSEILNWHYRCYPLLQAEDIYKLIFQGVFGPGHLGAELNELRNQLVKEIAGLKSCFEIEIIEPVDPEGQLVRVNLLGVVNSQAAQERLLQGVIKTCQEFVPEPGLMATRLELAVDWCQKNLPSQAEKLLRLSQVRPAAPVHSEIYRRVYRPAYRVIFARLWEG